MRRSATAVGVILLVLFSAVAPAAGAVGTNLADSADTANQDATLDCEYPYTGVDASGTEITIEEEPERIVTLNPSAAQTMWEIGGQEKVVGVSQFAGFLDGAESRTTVTSGFPSQVNVEKVINLEPDLVLAPNTIDNESIEQVRNAGITVYRFELADSIESIYQKTELVGQLTGECSGAEDVVADMQDRVNTIESAVQDQENPTVYWGTEAGITAGPNTFIGQAITKSGGHNIAGDANASRAYPQLSAEFIAEQDPEFVVVSVSPENLGNDSRSYIPEGSVLRNSTAWEEGNIVVVDTNNLSQPAPRVISPMTKFAEAFHPEAYAETNAPATTAETTEATDESTDSTTTTAATDPTTTTSNGNSPGFGIVAATVAILGAILFTRQ